MSAVFDVMSHWLTVAPMSFAVGCVVGVTLALLTVVIEGKDS